jgi:hypothetical protein
MLLHLPRMDDHRGPRVKNGPPLAGHGAEAVRDAIASTITTLPEQLWRSLTWDQGVELAQHAQLRMNPPKAPRCKLVFGWINVAALADKNAFLGKSLIQQQSKQVF